MFGIKLQLRAVLCTINIEVLFLPFNFGKVDRLRLLRSVKEVKNSLETAVGYLVILERNLLRMQEML